MDIINRNPVHDECAWPSEKVYFVIARGANVGILFNFHDQALNVKIIKICKNIKILYSKGIFHYSPFCKGPLYSLKVALCF